MAINLLETVQTLQETLSLAAKQSLDVLGMTFCYAKTSGKATKLKYNGYRWPRRKAVESLKEKIRLRIGRRYSLSLEEVIRQINPILRGWHHYFKVGHGEKTFRRLDRFVQNRLRIFVKRITVKGKAVGEPYRGKPDVRFDEGNLRTSAGQS